MTTPPPEPPSVPDDASGPLPPPPPLPPAPGDAAGPRKYDTRTMLWTAGITVLVIAVLSWLVPPAGLLVPVVLFVALFFLLQKDPTVRYRSVLAGLLLGLGVGLFVTAGVCSAVFSGALTSPTFR